MSNARGSCCGVRELLETATRGTVRFPRQVSALFTEAIYARNRFLRGEASLQELQERRDALDDRLLALARPPRSAPEYDRLAKHLWIHIEQWFALATDPSIEATHWKAEPAVRQAVVSHTVWGGNRTAAGTPAQDMLTSVLESCRRSARRLGLHQPNPALRRQPAPRLPRAATNVLNKYATPASRAQFGHGGEAVENLHQRQSLLKRTGASIRPRR